MPRLARLGQINDHTRISLGRIIDEQADGAPNGEFLLFDGRVHTYEGVNRRINNVVRGLIHVGVRQGVRVGVLMDTRPSALVAIAALSRLGAVAVLMPPDADLDEAARLGGVTEVITDPGNLEAARQLPVQILVLGGGESRDLHLPDDSGVIDPGTAKLEFSLPTTGGSQSVPVSDISFAQTGWMLVAQRTMGGDMQTGAHQSTTFEYDYQNGSWVSWGDGGSPDPTPLADARLVGLTFLLPPVVTAVFFVRHFARGGFRTVLTSVCLVGAIGWVLAAVALLAQ